jgi:hypothetical protein
MDVQGPPRVVNALARKESIIDVPAIRVPWASWCLLTVISTFAAASALWVVLTPAGDQTKLTGRAWEQFALQDPEVASLYSMDLVVLGLLGAGFGLMAAAVSVIPYRRGERWAWYALWLLPLTIGAVAARMLINQYSAAYYYAGITAASLVALLIPIRSVLRHRE